MDKVLVAPMHLVGMEGPHLDVLREAGLEPVFSPRAEQLLEDELIQALEGMSAALAGSEPYTTKVLARHPQLKVIARAGVGYDAVNVEAATAQGCAVTITPNTNQGSVAEHTFCLILGLARDLVKMHTAVKAGGWPRRPVIPLRGRTLGIAGCGRAGKAVAVRARAFEMNVLAYDPIPDEAFAKAHDVTLVSLEHLLAESDFVSLHLPLVPATHRIIDRRLLALMKPTAYLINTARGGVVNEQDLYEVLKNKAIAGAALDVFTDEPPGKNPLLDLDNVLLTPHSAGVDLQSRDDMALSAAQAIASLKKGEWPIEKVVNPEVRPSFSW